jgi:cytochrome c biogenesis protein CcdA/HEAT repeat protein
MVWFPSVEQVLSDASSHGRLALLLFTSQNCGWCARLKQELRAPSLQSTLRAFSLAEIDAAADARAAARYQVTATPTLIAVTADGRPVMRQHGFLAAPDLNARLTRARTGLTDAQSRPNRRLLAELSAGRLPTNRIEEALAALGDTDVQQGIRTCLLRTVPPRERLVADLTNAHLAVRLGALDLLEELAGDTLGLDPWEPATEPANAEALARWRDWAAGVTNETRYAALPPDRVEAFLRDVIGPDPGRAARAVQALARAGSAVRPQIEAYEASHGPLMEGARRRLREVRYAVQIPPRTGVSPAALAHRLVYGALDARQAALAELGPLLPATRPVVEEHLSDPEPIVREVAAETLARQGGKPALETVGAFLQRETDADVLYGVLRALGRVKGARSRRILSGFLGHANEDLVIVALGSLAEQEDQGIAAQLGLCLRDTRWRVRVAALDAARKVRATGLADAVTAGLQDEDSFVRQTAIAALPAVGAKRALPALETVFRDQPGLRPAVMAAFVAMEAAIPPAMRDTLRQGEAEEALSVLAAVAGDCEAIHLPFLRAMMEHRDERVVAEAAAISARVGLEDPPTVNRLLELLSGGPAAVRGRLLEGIVFSDKAREWLQARNPSWRASGGKAPAAAGGSSPAGIPAVSAAENAVDSFLTVFATAGPSTNVAAVPAADAPPAAPAAVSAQDAMDAFLTAHAAAPAVSTGTPSAGIAAATGTVAGAGLPGIGVAPSPAVLGRLAAAVEAVVGDPGRPDGHRSAAAVAMAGVGNPACLPYLTQCYTNLSTTQRDCLAYRIHGLAHPGALDLYRRLLSDPEEEVRSEAQRAPSRGGTPALAACALDALLAPDTRFRPADAGDLVESLRKHASGLPDRCRTQVLNLVLSGTNRAQRIEGLILLEALWREGDDVRIAPALGHDDPYVRRAAYRAVAGASRQAFSRLAGTAARDPSEVVRAVVPAAFLRSASEEWPYAFGPLPEDRLAAEHYHRYAWADTSRRGGPPSEAALAALRVLATNNVATVKAAALFALLENRCAVSLVDLLETLEQVEDPGWRSRAAARFLQSNVDGLVPAFRVLLPVSGISADDDDYSSRQVIERLGLAGSKDEGPASAAAPAVGSRATNALPAATPVRLAAVTNVAPAAPGVRLIYFRQPGCLECRRVEGWLGALQQRYPPLRIETLNVRLERAKVVSHVLGGRFQVPLSRRLLAPTVYGAGGALVKKEINPETLDRLVGDSATASDAILDVAPDEGAAAASALDAAYRSASIGLVLLYGLLDGVNPCAFATIAFLLSYLQLLRRGPRQVLQVGLAFVMAVFLAYTAIGFGLLEAVELLSSLERVGAWVHRLIALATLVLAAVSARDGVLCLRGRLADITLQLPGALKRGIHTAVRTGSRQPRFVLAAFATGVIVSLLELACTGQMYLPVVTYAWQHVRAASAAGLIVLYNVAFIVPLLVVFGLAYRGLRNETLVIWMRRRAALIKFATAALFGGLGAMLLWQAW